MSDLEKEETCIWHQCEDDKFSFAVQCRLHRFTSWFTFTEETDFINDAHFMFCPYCAKKIIKCDSEGYDMINDQWCVDGVMVDKEVGVEE